MENVVGMPGVRVEMRGMWHVVVGIWKIRVEMREMLRMGVGMLEIRVGMQEMGVRMRRIQGIGFVNEDNQGKNAGKSGWEWLIFQQFLTFLIVLRHPWRDNYGFFFLKNGKVKGEPFSKNNENVTSVDGVKVKVITISA